MRVWKPVAVVMPKAHEDEERTPPPAPTMPAAPAQVKLKATAARSTEPAQDPSARVVKADPRLASTMGAPDEYVDQRDRDNMDRTPLMAACAKREHGRCAELLARGANIALKDKCGRCACAALLPLTHGARRYQADALLIAVESGATECVKLLLAHGANAGWESNNGGETLLHLAVKRGLLDMARMLLDAGVPVDGLNWFGISPLAFALKLRDPLPMADLLLERGADVTTMDRIPRRDDQIQVPVWLRQRAEQLAAKKSGGGGGASEERVAALERKVQAQQAQIEELLAAVKELQRRCK